jgi:ABC-type transporter Mla subunit MlaD
MAAKNDYITIAPVTPKGKWTICMRRVGTKDRYAPVAEARTQIAADGIVDALNLMQGEIKKLEVPAQRLLEEVRAALTEERSRTRQLQQDVSNLKRTLGTEEGAHASTKRLLDAARNECSRLRADFVNYRDNNPEPKLVQSAEQMKAC